MRNVTTNVYQFDELSDAAKEKARDWWRAGRVANDLRIESVLDNFKQEMLRLGVEISDVTYDDYTVFGFEYTIDLPKWLEANASETDYRLVRRLLKNDKISASVRGEYVTNRYEAAPCPYIEPYKHSYISNRMDVKLIAFEVCVAQWLHSKAKALYLRIKEETNYIDLNEYIDECIRINEYEFTESGVHWR